MSFYPSKVNIQTAVKKSRSFDLSCQHLTTATFMRPSVVYAKEFPKAHVKANVKSYTRLDPLLKPVLGSVQFHNRAFFVPYRTIWPCWNEFITNAPFNTPEGTLVLDMVPRIPATSITDALVAQSTLTNALSYDFQVSTGGSEYFYTLTAQGRQYYKILTQLGYPLYGSGRESDPITETYYSALPLLAFCKVFLDWYFPAQYAHSGISASVDGYFQRNYQYDLSPRELGNLLDFVSYAYYGNDYFTSAFDNPVAPANGTSSSMAFLSDITSSRAPGGASSIGYDDVYSTPYLYTARSAGDVVSLAPQRLSQYIVDALKAVTNYQKRHQLVGARALDRYLADFGVALSAEKLRRSVYIKSNSFPIQFSEVLSNTDNAVSTDSSYSGAVLGDYAGKGVGYGAGFSFDYDGDEFGMLIVVNTVEPDIAYDSGFDRNVVHTGVLDFFQPEFESLGTQVVYRGELSLDTDSAVSPTESIFGFLPRYAEYKVGRDVVSGNFKVKTKQTSYLPWSTLRQVNPSSYSSHSLDFMRGTDNVQYLRIFYGDGKEEFDPFVVVYRIDIDAMLEAKPLYDTFDFDEEEGQEITMQPNGVQV